MDKLMNKIVCPNCGTEIELDDVNYSRIVAQVRTEQFDKEVAAQVKAVKEQQEAKHQSLLSDAANKYQRELLLKDQEITRLQEEAKNLSEKQQRELDAVIDQAEIKHQKDLAEKEQEITRLKEQAKGAAYAQKQELEAVRDKAEMKRREDLAEKDRQIQELQAQVGAAEKDKELAVNNAVHGKDTEIAELRILVEQQKQSADKDLQAEKDAHRKDVDQLNELVEYYKEMKIRQSTKMIGESLEQYCLNEFRKVQADAYPHAEFRKDNDAVDGSKGDFVFREKTEEDIEITSIMFEMKHEADDTVKKHKNEDFLAKLDKDRRNKNCEYAVLVTTLEQDNEYYNSGMVRAFQYEKMFIVRPQFFLPLISVLRNAGMARVDALRKLASIEQENIDVKMFEDVLNACKSDISMNYVRAKNNNTKAIEGIDAVIEKLKKIRDSLTGTEKNLRISEEKLQDLTIKKLTKDNPGMEQKFLDAGVAIAG